MTVMKNSLERIDPDAIATAENAGYETLQLHLQRYQYAARFLRKGYCADIACGTGYGSFLLASQFEKEIDGLAAIDIDPDSIERAKNRYKHPLIEFICTDAVSFIPKQPIQTIISLETIEHLKDPVSFVHNMCNVLNKGGRFIASAPITPSMDANPYHLHDFTKRSFIKLFTDQRLKLVDSFVQVQPYNVFSVLSKKEERSQGLRKGLLRYYFRHPNKLFLRLRSLSTDGFNNKYLVAVFDKL